MPGTQILTRSLWLVLALFSLLAPARAQLALTRVLNPAPIVVENPGGTVEVRLDLEPGPGVTVHAVSWRTQTSRINPAPGQGAVSFLAVPGAPLAIRATFASRGVYQIAADLTTNLGAHTVRTHVNVWDSRGSVSDQLVMGTHPGITPPPLVRQLHRDPGPFRHPRILVTDQDWADIVARSTPGLSTTADVAVAGASLLRADIANNLDKTGNATQLFAASLDAWVASGYLGPAPAWDPHLANGSKFWTNLADAALFSWLDHDPASPATAPAALQQRRAYLGRLLVGASKATFDAIWDSATGQPRSGGPVDAAALAIPGAPVGHSSRIALAYDYLYPHLTDEQRATVRNLLYLLGYGRITFRTHSSSRSNSVDASVNYGYEQVNGNHTVLSDSALYASLAIEGEDALVPAALQTHARRTGVGYDFKIVTWNRPADPADPDAWPGVTQATLDVMERNLNFLTHYITPWGLSTESNAYLGLASSGVDLPMLALARRGENAFATTARYQSVLSLLLTYHPVMGVYSNTWGTTRLATFDHHDGGNSISGLQWIMMKYFYPTDPAVDYIYRYFLVRYNGGRNDPLASLLFGLKPGVDAAGASLPLEQIGAAKQLPTLKYDPQHGVVSARNSWREGDLALRFDANHYTNAGHQHGEKNAFALLALGRAWSICPGYHMISNDAHSGVQVRNPLWASNPDSDGFVGVTPSSAYWRNQINCWPTPPARMVQVSHDEQAGWSVFAGDAVLAWNYTFGGAVQPVPDTGHTSLSLWPFGLAPRILELTDDHRSDGAFTPTAKVNDLSKAFRTMALLRGAHPYVLVFDDVAKPGGPHDWRWFISATGGEHGTLAFTDNTRSPSVRTRLALSEATAREGVLRHSPVDDGDAPGKPRLLVRDLSLIDTTDQPALFVQDRNPANSSIPREQLLTVGYDFGTTTLDYVDNNRLIIERRQVERPDYAVLLFPFLTGTARPVTTWNAEGTTLSVTLPDGARDEITVDRNYPDGRLRVVQIRRFPAGVAAAPAFTSTPAPAAVADTTIDDAPSLPVARPATRGAVVDFAASATTSGGAPLAPRYLVSPNQFFPAGLTLAYATARDPSGASVSRAIPVAVQPAAPAPSLRTISRDSEGRPVYTLGWNTVSAYHEVWRSSAAGQRGDSLLRFAYRDTFADSPAGDGPWFYTVSGWAEGLVAPASPALRLAPPPAPLAYLSAGGALTGGAARVDQRLAVTGDGSLGSGTSDGTEFLAAPIARDGVAIARLLTPATGARRFGLLLRESSAANARFSFVGLNSGGLQTIHRNTAGNTPAATAGASVATPVWLRLTRSGSTVQAATSPDGLAWTHLGAPGTWTTSTGSALWGLVAASGDSSLATSEFASFSALVTRPLAASLAYSITLDWTGSATLGHFRVERAANGSPDFVTVADQLAGTTWEDASVTDGVPYAYRVVAVEDGVARLVSESVTQAVGPAATPAAPVFTSGFNQVTLTWPAVLTANTYSVRRAPAGTGQWTEIASGLATPTFTDTGVLNGLAYDYEIISVNPRGSSAPRAVAYAAPASSTIKLNNAIPLDSATSWDASAVPNPVDIARWSGTYSQDHSIGAGLRVAGLEIGTASRGIVINSGTGNLVVGAAGIAMGAATQNLTVHAPLLLSASQTWDIASGRTLTLAGPLTLDPAAPPSARPTKAGAGTVAFTAPLSLEGLQIAAGTTQLNGAAYQSLSELSGAGSLHYNNTSPTPGLVHFAGGAFGTFRPGGNTVVLRNSAPVTFTNFGPNNATTWTTVFDGGAWTVGTFASNSGQNGGALRVTGGATLALNSARFGGHGQWTLGGPEGAGTLTATGLTMESLSTVPFSVTVAGQGTFIVPGAFTFSLSQAVTGPRENLLRVQPGGAARFGGNLTLGSTTAPGAGGSETTRVELAGGKLLVAGTLAAATATSGQTRRFEWSGGQLAAATLTPSAGFADPAPAGGLTATALVHPSGAILAPGDSGAAGRTVLNGAYTQRAGAVLDLDVGGATQATAYQTGQYDFLSVSGAATLAGDLRVRLLNAYAPGSAQSFTVLRAGGGLSGAFANAAPGTRVVTESLTGSFAVTHTSTDLVLGSYQTHAPREGWRLRHFGRTEAAGTAADAADPDRDGFANLLEYALDTAPLAPGGAGIPACAFVPATSTLAFTFFRARADLTYTVEASSTLAPDSWSVLATNPGAVGQQVTVTDSVSVNPRRFLRLRVIAP